MPKPADYCVYLMALFSKLKLVYSPNSINVIYPQGKQNVIAFEIINKT